MPRAGRPAATAPLVTTTTAWPAERRSATSVASFSTAARSTVPSAAVIDDVPILAMTVATSVGLVLEGQATDADLVTGLGTGAGERLDDAEAPQPVVGVGQRA